MENNHGGSACHYLAGLRRNSDLAGRYRNKDREHCRSVQSPEQMTAGALAIVFLAVSGFLAVMAVTLVSDLDW
jgi:hypothetical protein